MYHIHFKTLCNRHQISCPNKKLSFTNYFFSVYGNISDIETNIRKLQEQVKNNTNALKSFSDIKVNGK